MSMQQCRCQHLKVTADPQRELEWIEDIDIHTHCFKVGQVSQKCYSADPGCILVIFYGLQPVRPF